MPGSVQNADPVTVMPYTLCKAFEEARAFETLQSEYSDGSYQGSRRADTSRKSWHTRRRLTAGLMSSLRAFYLARHGSHEPFYYYNPRESGFTYDPTGADPTGRYTVRFLQDTWEQVIELGRGEVDIEIIEIA